MTTIKRKRQKAHSTSSLQIFFFATSASVLIDSFEIEKDFTSEHFNPIS
jgi:hypothetical protein